MEFVSESYGGVKKSVKKDVKRVVRLRLGPLRKMLKRQSHPPRRVRRRERLPLPQA
jgi:hypothetical protein